MWRLDISPRHHQKKCRLSVTGKQKDSATGTFVNKDVTSKLIILSSGSREISEISWTKCEELRICEEVFPVYSFRIRA